MKPLHLPITGHDLLAVERFRDSTRHMIEFLVLANCALGKPGEYVRRFLTEDGYGEALAHARQGSIQIRKHASISRATSCPTCRGNGVKTDRR